LPPSLHVNLRNHRKLLVTDGRIGFTGGMNIGDRHLAERTDNVGRVTDLHFRLQGEIVQQLERAFIADWRFVTGEQLASAPIESVPAGTSVCRTIVDGPNEDFERLTTILVAAVSLARQRVTIVTPYFLPSRELIAALRTAALRGVRVVVILPGKNNLPYVHWATRNMLWQLLQWNIEIYYQPPPFSHTKLFMIDDHYAQIGSANIDPRSLRLNFELMVEIYDAVSLSTWVGHTEKIRQRSQRISLEEINGRSLPVKIRDAVAWLFSPYL
jgi:cardiolipin synthase